MRAGRLRHRVTLQRKVVTRDAYGGEVITWTDVATVWAAVEPLRGRELEAAAQAGAELSARIVMRYRSDVVPEWRVAWDGHVYDIEAVVDVDGRHRTLELRCREVLGREVG